MKKISIELLNEQLTVLWKYNELKRCIKLFENLSGADKKLRIAELEKLILEQEELEDSHKRAVMLTQDIIVINIDLFVEYLEKSYPNDKSSIFALDPYEIVTETILSILNRGRVIKMKKPLIFENENNFMGSFIELMKWKRLTIMKKFSTVNVEENDDAEDDAFYENGFEEVLRNPQKHKKEIADVNSLEKIDLFENEDEQKHKQKFLLYYTIKVINQVQSEKRNIKPFRALQRKLKWQYGNDKSTIMKAALKTYKPSIVGKEGLRVFINRYKAWNRIKT